MQCLAWKMKKMKQEEEGWMTMLHAMPHPNERKARLGATLPWEISIELQVQREPLLGHSSRGKYEAHACYCSHSTRCWTWKKRPG